MANQQTKWKTKVYYEDATTGERIPPEKILNYKILTTHKQKHVQNGNGTLTITYTVTKCYKSDIFGNE